MWASQVSGRVNVETASEPSRCEQCADVLKKSPAEHRRWQLPTILLAFLCLGFYINHDYLTVPLASSQANPTLPKTTTWHR